MTDVLVEQTPDGGEIEIINGLLTMTGGFQIAFYYAIFGGNKDDDGTENSVNNWWGNLVETDSNLFYRSKTQNIIQTLVPISGNLLLLEAAVEKDLDVFKRIGTVDNITVSGSLIDVRKVQIKISVLANGENTEITFIENWRAMEEELA